MRFSRMHRGLASPINLSDDSKFIIPMECLINQSRVIMLSYILFCQLWNVTLDLSRLTKCINIIIYNYYFKFPTNTFMLFGNLQKGKSFKKLSYLFFFFFQFWGLSLRRHGIGSKSPVRHNAEESLQPSDKLSCLSLHLTSQPHPITAPHVFFSPC